jgi:acetyl esterase/lipase
MRIAVSILGLFAYAVSSAARSADAPAVKVLKDVPYLSGANYSANKDKLDLYLPERRTNVPVVVSYYGGGLTAGDKNAQAFIGQRFAAAGFATAVVNYRLTPEVQHPAHVQDAAASFAWVKRHIAEYGGDPAQVFIIGHSAGAYLVALLSTDERYLAAHQLSLRDIRGVVPVSAFYWVEKSGVAPDRDKRIWGTDQKAWADASPAHHLSPGVPATLILYADGDDEWRRQQNVDAAKALKGAGARDVTITMIAGRTHNTIWSKVAEAGDETATHIIDFVRAHSTRQLSQ